MRSVILFSGGVDSTVLLAQAVEKHGAGQVLAVFFRYGQRHYDAEWRAGLHLARHYGVERKPVSLLDLSLKSSLTGEGELTGSAVVVPYRNGVFASMGAAIADSIGASEVLIGTNAADHLTFPDCRPLWSAAQAEAVRLGTEGRVIFHAPFAHWDKARIVEEGNRLQVPWSMTWSCYAGEKVPCGKCGACVERGKVLG